ncbi:uncharacterized protein LOC118430440 [Branchiostoma floridae]|uniref:Uncharacterized protein LOC118430440 n=1 Tax=Branchiostoma floridae TaxID=7739 RepID=A0A9J7MAA7_BRAFL|nr:uncharacterized protein LOC118430440 [Branchiostoma floridae]
MRVIFGQPTGTTPGEVPSGGGILPGALYRVNFPGPRSPNDYVELRSDSPFSPDSFTISFHMRTPARDTGTIFSYGTQQQPREIAFIGQAGSQSYTFFVNGERATVTIPKVLDGQWHVVAITWRNSDGQWRVMVDGQERASGSGLARGHRIRPGGTWILGQDQNIVGVRPRFERNNEYLGDIAEFHVHDEVLSDDDLRRLYSLQYPGDAVNWRRVAITPRGSARRTSHPVSVRLTVDSRGRPRVIVDAPSTVPTTGQEKTKCQTLLETTQTGGARGAFIPQCEEDGSFKTTQCHGSSGYCYCAHPTDGTRYEETGRRSWEGGMEHDCDTYWQTKGQEKTKCQTELETTEAGGAIGAFTPQCEEDGSYKTTQCHGSSGYCYCAHPTDGTRYEETGRRSWEGGMEHDCDTYWQTKGQEKTKCQTQVETTVPAPGAFIPQCEEDGSFKTTQCHGSTGYCYCAHPTDGTRYEETGRPTGRGQGTMDHDCNTYWQTREQEKTKCQTLVETTVPAPGAFIPQCEEDGSFKTTQCHGSTGYCYCAHPTDGTRYDETGRPTGRGQGTMDHDCNTYWKTRAIPDRGLVVGGVAPGGVAPGGVVTGGVTPGGVTPGVTSRRKKLPELP